VTRAEPVKHTRRMAGPKAAVVTDSTIWQGTVEAGAETERLGWPLAAGIIVLLSVGLWAGIGWLAAALLG